MGLLSGTKVGHAPPPITKRVVRSMNIFMLSKEEIAKFWAFYCRFDLKHQGFITMDTFFESIVFEDRNDFGNKIFELIDADDPEQILFGEFVEGVCTFACLNTAEILRFAFLVYAKKGAGVMEIEELHHFINKLHKSRVNQNIQHAVSNLALDELGRLPFEGFKLMHKQYPLVLYPVFQLQINVRRCIMGTSWWKNKINYIQYWRANKVEIEIKAREKRERGRQRHRNWQVFRKMGVVSYCTNAPLRKEFQETLEKAYKECDLEQAITPLPAPGEEGGGPGPDEFTMSMPIIESSSPGMLGNMSMNVTNGGFMGKLAHTFGGFGSKSLQAPPGDQHEVPKTNNMLASLKRILGSKPVVYAAEDQKGGAMGVKTPMITPVDQVLAPILEDPSGKSLAENSSNNVLPEDSSKNGPGVPTILEEKEPASVGIT